jgi:hypothetical protein
MGPDDVSSIRAAGKLAGVDSLERNAQAFDKAFRTIRAIHQGVGRRLARMIRESSRYLVEDEPSGSFGDHLWLPINELLETVDIAEVIERRDPPRAIPPYLAGRFLMSSKA